MNVSVETLPDMQEFTGLTQKLKSDFKNDGDDQEGETNSALIPYHVGGTPEANIEVKVFNRLVRDI